MSFFILSASNSEYNVNQPVLQGIVARNLGEPAITVASEYLSYKDKVLSILTEITFGGFAAPTFHEAVRSSYFSTFEIEPELLIAEGNYDEAVEVLRKCHDLAQAHAYSIYLLLCAENAVPQTGMDKTPLPKYNYKAENFLGEIKLTHSEK